MFLAGGAIMVVVAPLLRQALEATRAEAYGTALAFVVRGLLLDAGATLPFSSVYPNLAPSLAVSFRCVDAVGLRAHRRLHHGRGRARDEIKVPTCPARLCPAAKAEWKRLAQELFLLGIVTELDRAALAAYCQAYGRWAEAERKLKDTPMLLKLPSGYIQPNPWLVIANKQLELMHKYMAEIGLSPVSRSRVEARPPHQRSKFAGLLGRPADDQEYLFTRHRS